MNNLIAKNAYAILGLDISASPKQISKRANDMKKYAKIGEIMEFAGECSYYKDIRNEANIAWAISELNTPNKQALHAFLRGCDELGDLKKAVDLSERLIDTFEACTPDEVVAAADAWWMVLCEWMVNEFNGVFQKYHNIAAPAGLLQSAINEVILFFDEVIKWRYMGDLELVSRVSGSEGLGLKNEEDLRRFSGVEQVLMALDNQLNALKDIYVVTTSRSVADLKNELDKIETLVNQLEILGIAGSDSAIILRDKIAENIRNKGKNLFFSKWHLKEVLQIQILALKVANDSELKETIIDIIEVIQADIEEQKRLNEELIKIAATAIIEERKKWAAKAAEAQRAEEAAEEEQKRQAAAEEEARAAEEARAKQAAQEERQKEELAKELAAKKTKNEIFVKLFTIIGTIFLIEITIMLAIIKGHGLIYTIIMTLMRLFRQ